MRTTSLITRLNATLAKNDSPATRIDSKLKVLDVLPRGAYTTARTFKKYSVFELETHVTRMAQTCRLLAESSDLPTELSEPSILSSLIQRSMASAISAYEVNHSNHPPADEYKLTVVATWDGIAGAKCSQRPADPREPNFDVYCHCQPLEYTPPSIVKVEVRGSPRENALAKDSSWTVARKPLEELMSGDCDELLLQDVHGGIPEGSQTNFFAIDGVSGELVTAGEGVLEGTVRKLVLQVCAADGIGVRLEVPSLQGARESQWAGCAVSSTSRLFLPVHEVTMPVEGLTVQDSGGTDACLVFSTATYRGAHKDLCQHIADRVQEEVQNHSTRLSEFV